MPTSLRQWKANRENAQKSTGPRTDAGKAASSRNAIKHGLYAADLIINSNTLKEQRTEYDALVAGLVEDFKPQGAFQQQLVARIAICLWRQRRLLNAETAYINRELRTSSLFSSYSFGDLTDEQVRNSASLMDRVHANTIPDGDFAKNLMRYEYRLDRQLTHAVNLLRTLQREQNQKNTKTNPIAPTAATIDSTPESSAADFPICRDHNHALTTETEKHANEPNPPQPDAIQTPKTGSAPRSGGHSAMSNPVIPAEAGTQGTPPFVEGSELARDDDDDDDPEYRQILHFGG